MGENLAIFPDYFESDATDESESKDNETTLCLGFGNNYEPMDIDQKWVYPVNLNSLRTTQLDANDVIDLYGYETEILENGDYLLPNGATVASDVEIYFDEKLQRAFDVSSLIEVSHNRQVIRETHNINYNDSSTIASGMSMDTILDYYGRGPVKLPSGEIRLPSILSILPAGEQFYYDGALKQYIDIVELLKAWKKRNTPLVESS